MKRIVPILTGLCLLALASCIKDDIENCAGKMHFYFSFLYGGVNRFFDMEKTDLSMQFYRHGNDMQYREMNVDRSSIDIQKPLTIEKTPDDTDSLEVVLWSRDGKTEHIDTPRTPLGEGYLHLKEMTAGSGICRPADDLFYGRLKFDAGDRYKRIDQTVPFVRAVCRIRITMIPQTVEGQSEGSGTIVPRPDDYVFHLMNTRNEINDNNITGGEKIILQPDCYYDAASGNVKTDWFGAFSSNGEYLYVEVFIRDHKVATFDCAPIKLASVPGDNIDLIIDGHYVNPVMQVKVNGWKVAVINSEL